MESTIRCPKCNVQNPITSKFCQQCGADLSEAHNIKPCPGCGTDNTPDAKFCSNCGIKLGPEKAMGSPGTRKRERDKRKAKPNKSYPEKRISLNFIKISALFFVAAVIYMLIPENKKTRYQQTADIAPPITATEQKSMDPKLEARVLDIASKFICSCGTDACGKESLKTCRCDVAFAERQHIRRALQNKKNAGTIIKEINSKFGWIQPQYKAQYGPGKFRPNFKETLSTPPGINLLLSQENMKPASTEDRLAIVSSFSCTCGQCNIDELKKCNCTHPRGATEVKNFIDLKISEAKYSKEKIIQLVDARYGNRIR